MTLPSKIKLSGFEIEVKHEPSNGGTTNGEYNNYFSVIKINTDKDVPNDVQEETLLHEIIEAISAKNNLEIDHKNLTVLSMSIYQVLKDNELFGAFKE